MIRNALKNMLFYIMLIACALPLALPAAAKDDARNTSLTVAFLDEGKPISGCAFSVWQIAALSADGAYATAEAFAAADVSLDRTNAQALASLAASLGEYVARETVAPLETGTTGANGKLSFGNASVGGAYLVVGKSITVGGYRYTPSPFIVFLPGVTQDGAPLYDVESEVKFTKNRDGDTTAPTTTEVPGSEPSSVPPPSDTTPGEPTAPDVSTTAPEPPVTTETPSGGDQPSVPTTRTEVTTPSGSSDKLPQTGTLLWLVPVLLVIGGAIFGAGVILKKRAEHE